MTKVDERAPVPELDSDARERLAAAVDRDGVVAASLFGSQAMGRSGPLSDVDVAVWLDPGLDPGARWQLRLELARAATAALSTPEVDIVVLNRAPPLLQHRAMRGAVRLLDRDPRARVQLETEAILKYLDTAPLRETLDAARRARLEEGRFGRR